MTTGATQAGEPDLAHAAPSTDSTRYGDWRQSLLALAVWAIGLAGALIVVRGLHLNPLYPRGAMFPLAVLLPAGLVLGPILWFLLRKWAAPIAVGAYGAWLGMVMAQALTGTPYGYQGLQGDAMWMGASVMRYSTTWKPTDPFNPHVPAEYPPLYHWVLGRLSVALHMPPFHMLKWGEIVLGSLIPVLAYILWARLVPAFTAVALAVLPQVVFNDALRPYEIVAVATILPLVLGTFVENLGPRARRLPWWAAGVLFGLTVLTYMGFVMFAAAGIAIIVAINAYRSNDRKRYLAQTMGTVAVAVLVASWFLIPFIRGLLHFGGNRVGDLFVSPSFIASPIGLGFGLVGVVAVLSLIGVIGIAYFWRSRWWAQPSALVWLGALIYTALFLLLFVATGHTGVVHYVGRLTATTLASCGVLVLSELLASARPRIGHPRADRLALAGIGMLLAGSAAYLWASWTPGMPGSIYRNLVAGDFAMPKSATAAYNSANTAHAEPLPTGQPPNYASTLPIISGIPATQVAADVYSTLGKGANPETLSVDGRLYSFVPWPGYMGPGRTSASTYIQWDWRLAELHRLSGITDPTQFAAASANTKYGPIDCFFLVDHGGVWHYEDQVDFNPQSFDAKYWDVYQGLMSSNESVHYVLVVRKHQS